MVIFDTPSITRFIPLYIGLSMNKKFGVFFLLIIPMVIGKAYADDGSLLSSVKVSGFGTGALTRTNSDDVEFRRPNQASGAKRDWDNGVDSNIGLQADMPLGAMFSATAAGLVRKDAEEGFGGELTMAFVKAKLSNDLSIRVGRVILPAFMISEYRNVGYAHTFVRPPNELYSQVSIDSLDGADINYRMAMGETVFGAQLGVGQDTITTQHGDGTHHVKAKSLTAVNLTAENGPLLLRFGRIDTKLTVDDWAFFTTFTDQIAQLGTALQIPQLNALSNALAVRDSKASFTSVGLGYDARNIVVQAEYGATTTNLADSKAWYVMGAYRFGKFLPYYTHGKLKTEGKIVNTVPALPAFAAISAVVQALNTPVEQSTDTVGVRWDFASSAALKLQVDRVKPKGGSGILSNAAPGFKGPLTVGTVALDFIF